MTLRTCLQAPAAVALVLAASVEPVEATEAPRCAAWPDFVERLDSQFGEKRKIIGLTLTGNVMEIYVAEDGAWTMIITQPSGLACAYGAGEALEVLEVLPGRPS